MSLWILPLALLSLAASGDAGTTSHSCALEQAAAQRRPLNDPAVRAVERLERAWLDAYEKNDMVAMRRILADEFVITHAEGQRETKSQILSAMAKQPAGAGHYRHHTENREAVSIGDIVILRGEVVSARVNRPTDPPQRRLYTDVYRRVAGRWQVLTSHLSMPGAPRPAAG